MPIFLKVGKDFMKNIGGWKTSLHKNNGKTPFSVNTRK